MRSLLIEVCRKRERSAALAALTSHISAIVELVRELARILLQRYHDLKTSRWQEDNVHETVGMDETSTQNERVAGRVAVKRQQQLGPASPSNARRTRFRTRTRFSQARDP